MNVALFDQVKMRLMKAGLHPMCLYKRESLDIETDSYSRRQCEDKRKMLATNQGVPGSPRGWRRDTGQMLPLRLQTHPINIKISDS